MRVVAILAQDCADLSRIYADPRRNVPVALTICHKRAAPSLDVMWQAWVGNSPTNFRSGSEQVRRGIKAAFLKIVQNAR